jgi:hypothetical protein
VSAPLTEFSEGRAWPHLEALCSYGVRMVGSKANEENAVFYMMRELDIIRRGVTLTLLLFTQSRHQLFHVFPTL